MLGHGLQRFGVPALAAAVLLWAAGVGWAQHGGGGHGGGGGGHGGGGGGGHGGGGHYGGGGGGHYGGGHYGGGYGGHYGGYGGYHHGYGGYYHNHGFYGGGFALGLYPGFYGYGGGYYGGGYYPGAYQSFYPYVDSYPDVGYPPVPPVANPDFLYTPVGGAAPLSAPIVAPTGPGTAVNFRVQVPPTAEIWIEGKKTNQTGAVRQFESPPLPPGVDYQYQIRARWTQGGTVIDQTRKMSVRAGDQFMVSFGKPASPPLGARTSQSRP